MSARYIARPTLKGGEDGNGKCGLIIGLIIAVVIIAVLICVMLIPCSSSSSAAATTTGLARFSKSKKKKSEADAKKRAGARGVRAGTGVRAGGYPAQWPAQQHQQPKSMAGHAGAVRNPRAVGHHAPAAQASAPAPLPSAQLMAPTVIPVPPGSMDMVQSSSANVGEYDDQGSASVNQYTDKNYTMDPGMMTTSSTTDIQGIETFMPMMSGGVGGKDGPVDPSTGLPLFTTGKLVRSQMLGGHGAGSFLRQQQDPLAGYAKSVGRSMCGSQAARENIAARRTQFNAARLADPNGDPVLFNTSEFMYY